MKRNKIISVLCFMLLGMASTVANCRANVAGRNQSVFITEGQEVSLSVKTNIRSTNNGYPTPKSPILIPEVTMDGYTLHFITPCTGLTLQLVQDDEVCYETVITSDYLEIPSGITGVYELQILRGDYVFFAEIEL